VWEVGRTAGAERAEPGCRGACGEVEGYKLGRSLCEKEDEGARREHRWTEKD